MPAASGNCPQSPASSATPGSAAFRPGRAARSTISRAASAGLRTFRLIVRVSSSAVRRARLVTRTRLPAAPGSSGRTWALPIASSMTMSTRRPATRARQRVARASRPGGICRASTPTASSRLASAFAGSTRRCSRACPASDRKICPSGNRDASLWAACTAKAVLPTPAIPLIPQTATASPDAAASAAASRSRNSASRPVNEFVSRGSVRIAATGAGRDRRVWAIARRSASWSGPNPSSSRPRARN